MKLISLLVLFFVTSSFGDTPVLQAKMSSIAIQPCRRAQSAYELDIEGTFELENTSKETILVPKKADLVRTVVAATSTEEAKRKVYSFIMNQEFGRSTSPAPRLEDFIPLKPGQKGLVQIGAVVPVNSDPIYSGKERLRPGRSWVQFEFSTIPSSVLWSHKSLKFWNKKWKSTGILVSKYMLTQPFPVDVVPNAEAPKCDSK